MGIDHWLLFIIELLVHFFRISCPFIFNFTIKLFYQPETINNNIMLLILRMPTTHSKRTLQNMSKIKITWNFTSFSISMWKKATLSIKYEVCKAHNQYDKPENNYQFVFHKMFNIEQGSFHVSHIIIIQTQGSWHEMPNPLQKSCLWYLVVKGQPGAIKLPLCRGPWKSWTHKQSYFTFAECWFHDSNLWPPVHIAATLSCAKASLLLYDV